MLLAAVGLTIPPDPVKTFVPDEAQIVQAEAVNYFTIINYLCRYECQRREYDPDYCQKACGD
jgi:hypothetical protein